MLQLNQDRESSADAAAPYANYSTPGIERRKDLSYDEFVRDFLNPNRPVIITDAIQKWRALSRWTSEFFKTRYSSMEVTIDGKQYKFGEYMDLVAESSYDNPAPYLRAQRLHKLFPDLMQDIEPLPKYYFPNWADSRFFFTITMNDLTDLSAAEICIGGTGGSFPNTHYDVLRLHVLLSQILGRKRFILFSPAQTPFLYAKNNKSLINDVENPDLEKFPLFAKAVPLRFVLEAGETLFIPGGWWHTTQMLSTSISVSRNFVNSSNWTDFTRDFYTRIKRRRPSLAIPYVLYLAGFRGIKEVSEWIAGTHVV